MYIGKVIGNIVATIKHPTYESRPLLLVERLTPAGDSTDYYDIAIDVAQAGPGDIVLLIDEGNGARQILQLDAGPVRAVIVGIIDEVSIMNKS